MRFKIVSVDNKGFEHIYYLDNKTLDITTDKNIPLCLHNDPRFRNLSKKYTQISQDEIISNEPKELRIQLGLNCNYSCKYCHQHFENKYIHEHKIQLPIHIRIKQFINLLQEKKIKPKNIALWGGEPLVYWKSIKILVPALRKLYADIPIYFLTNGSLINDDIIDFCLKYKLGITLSHDAQAFSTYRNDKNPLDNPIIICALKRYISAINSKDSNLRFNINVVITPENSNLKEIDNYFTTKFGYPVNWSIESIVRLGVEASSIITPFSLLDVKQLYDSMLELCLKGLPLGRGIDHHIYKALNYFINNDIYINQHYPCNNSSKDVLITTLDGTVLACHGADESYATIGHLNFLGSVKNTKLIPWKNRIQCQDCLFLLLCKGGCPLMNDEDVNAACHNLRLWYFGIFKCVWLLLFNQNIQSIEPIKNI